MYLWEFGIDVHYGKLEFQEELFESIVWCLKHVNMCGIMMSEVLIKKYWRVNMHSSYNEVLARV
jgi:hypothetical protein